MAQKGTERNTHPKVIIFDAKSLDYLRRAFASLIIASRQEANRKMLCNDKLINLRVMIDTVKSTKTHQSDFNKQIEPYLEKYGYHFVRAFFMEHGKLPPL